MDENQLSPEVIGAAIEVHKELGPGLLEFLYEEALAIELSSRGFDVARQVEVPVSYKKLGLLINFNSAVVRQSIKRVVNNL